MRRGAPLVAATAALSVGILLAACGTSAALGKGFFGVSASGALDARDYKMMGNAGVASFRFGIPWAQVQAQKGPCKPTNYQPPINQCSWGGTDAIVTELAKQNITPLATVSSTPQWANHRKGFYAERYTPLETSAGTKGWKAFLAAAARRYGPNGQFWLENPGLPERPIRLWQIWNEQNSSNMFRPHPKPSAYAALLKVSAKALRNAEPSASIMLGGMFGTPGGGGAEAQTAWSFLRGLYKAHARGSFDSVALHPYSPNIGGIKYQLKKLHGALKAEHDTGKETWITELGWGSDAKHVRNHLVKSPVGQKRLLQQSFKLLLAKRRSYNLGGVIWYSWRDPAGNQHTCQFCYSSGLLKQNSKPKPAFNEFKKFAPGP